MHEKKGRTAPSAVSLLTRAVRSTPTGLCDDFGLGRNDNQRPEPCLARALCRWVGRWQAVPKTMKPFHHRLSRFPTEGAVETGDRDAGCS